MCICLPSLVSGWWGYWYALVEPGKKENGCWRQRQRRFVFRRVSLRVLFNSVFNWNLVIGTRSLSKLLPAFELHQRKRRSVADLGVFDARLAILIVPRRLLKHSDNLIVLRGTFLRLFICCDAAKAACGVRSRKGEEIRSKWRPPSDNRKCSRRSWYSNQRLLRCLTSFAHCVILSNQPQCSANSGGSSGQASPDWTFPCRWWPFCFAASRPPRHVWPVRALSRVARRRRTPPSVFVCPPRASPVALSFCWSCPMRGTTHDYNDADADSLPNHAFAGRLFYLQGATLGFQVLLRPFQLRQLLSHALLLALVSTDGLLLQHKGGLRRG